MSHKGNFNVTEMGRIALSLQELIDRLNAQVTSLETERTADKKLLKQFRHTNGQLRAKIEKQQEMIKYDIELMEGQSQVMGEYKQLLDEMKRPWQRWFLKKGK
jgi:predicted RNA-binding protein with RPS1 domain